MLSFRDLHLPSLVQEALTFGVIDHVLYPCRLHPRIGSSPRLALRFPRRARLSLSFADGLRGSAYELQHIHRSVAVVSTGYSKYCR